MKKHRPILYRKISLRHNFIIRCNIFDSLIFNDSSGVSTEKGHIILVCKGSRKDSHRKKLWWVIARNRILQRHRWQGKYIREGAAVKNNKKIPFNKRRTWQFSSDYYAYLHPKNEKLLR